MHEVVTEAHAGAYDVSAYAADVGALVERLRGLGPVQPLAVIDLAERMDAAVLHGDVEGRERVRREFGIAGRVLPGAWRRSGAREPAG